jgi:hypothetical protein
MLWVDERLGGFSPTDFIIHVAMPALAECRTLCAQGPSRLRLQPALTANLRLRGLVDR